MATGMHFLVCNLLILLSLENKSKSWNRDSNPPCYSMTGGYVQIDEDGR